MQQLTWPIHGDFINPLSGYFIIGGDFVHSILDLSSCPLEWKTSSSFEVLNLTWILMAVHPLSMVDWCYVSLKAESDGFLIKMHRCHCYKPRLLWQDVCGTCPPLFFQLIKGGVGCHHIWENDKNTEFFKGGIWIKWNCIKIALNCGWCKWCEWCLVEWKSKMLLYR